MTTRVLVTGAGGFIGHHLATSLKAKGYWVRGADLKEPEFEPTAADEFLVCDLRRPEDADRASEGIDEVYDLAADMGGIGYITAGIARNDTLINQNMLDAAVAAGVDRFLFSSSACVYPQHKQHDADVTPLREEDAWPADPEPGYGLETHVARFHNVYGPLGTYEGGKERAPAALCRKIALAEDGDEIEVWGDGEQKRSFLYIDDCVEGVHRLMRSDHHEPLNLGTEELVTINELVDIISDAANKTLHKRYDLSKPQGREGEEQRQFAGPRRPPLGTEHGT
jgi:GDP-D-mannose 3',5'-epimerase